MSASKSIQVSLPAKHWRRIGLALPVKERAMKEVIRASIAKTKVDEVLTFDVSAEERLLIRTTATGLGIYKELGIANPPLTLED